VIRARLALTLPDSVWVASVSRANPDATLRLLAAAPVDTGTFELGEVRAAVPEAVLADIEAHPDVVAVETLFVGADRALLRYETTERGLFELLGAAALPPEFPLVVEDGEMAFTVTATRADFEALTESLDAGEVAYDLHSLVHDEGSRAAVLTDRQRECLRVARRLGYFEVPRTATLAEVAAALDVDPSTASETLRRGTARVLAWFLDGID
jgi:predicted DNA binding protein